MMTVDCDSIGYWREALFIASATHGEIPCARNQTDPLPSIARDLLVLIYFRFARFTCWGCWWRMPST